MEKQHYDQVIADSIKEAQRRLLDSNENYGLLIQLSTKVTRLEEAIVTISRETIDCYENQTFSPVICIKSNSSRTTQLQCEVLSTARTENSGRFVDKVISALSRSLFDELVVGGSISSYYENQINTEQLHSTLNSSIRGHEARPVYLCELEIRFDLFKLPIFILIAEV
ncbi:hypothetical protein LRP52_29185 [Photobacterium sp. ZSDE20]|uniref:Uncharacterized protein n=1 Tax=Photobacterium pectinilyticum TaxID=2906793 RepID=A0ABT1N835_9GAMM|nr:hypothetical protein [Photobacterium sp. ZSDE20]MCQ1060267.1 hypothetical protein [Photobacterium sp. ZSDE20]MDD1826254.1 hypothetical protein [Photobacterium sp. ZSDE20]